MTSLNPSESSDSLTLTRVIGQTSLGNATFCSASPGYVAYAAGCVVVLYNPQTNKQLGFFRVSRAVSCLSFSHDGKFIAIGERGRQPCVSVWETSTFSQLISFTGHQHGVAHVMFSPNGLYLVSVGFKHDKQLLLWEWASERLICTHKIENKVNAISFHSSGNFFVTCGDRHLKWWYLITDNTPNSEHIVTGINGRPASILETQRNSNFVDVLCPTGQHDSALRSNVYCTTSTGLLCLVHESRLMDKWVQLDSPASFCLALTSSLLLVGCTNGRIYAFSPVSLEYIATLPLPGPLCNGTSEGSIQSPRSSGTSSTSKLQYPACYGLCAVPLTSYVAASYADRSIFIWDVSDVLNVARYRSFVFHRSCIWDLQFVEASSSLPTSVSSEDISDPLPLPQGTFITCGADNTVHVWNIDPKLQRKSKFRSSYSRDLLHSFYLDAGDVDISASVDYSSSAPDTELPDRQQGRLAARCLAVHPNGSEVACGDRRGLLHIFDLRTMKPAEGTANGVRAHAAEILSLNYSPYMASSTPEEITSDADRDLVFLASGGRDRLVHVFDASPSNSTGCGSYTPVTTLDGHSSSVTVVKFSSDGKRLVSCGGDKTMVLNAVKGRDISRARTINTPHGTINGMALDAATNKFAVSTGQDKRINVWNITSGKLMRSYRPSDVNGELYKCAMDPSGMFVATCSFDKYIRLYDFFSGELIQQVSGHSDLITGVKFSSDGRSLYSVGGDGCIMIWDLSQDLVEAMQDRLVELFANAQKKKKVVDEKARLASSGQYDKLAVKNISAKASAIRASGGVRTGGGLAQKHSSEPSSDENSMGVVGTSVSSRPATVDSSGGSASTHSVGDRPATSAGAAQMQLGKKVSAARMPAWAARGEGKCTTSASGVAPPPAAGKWASRVDPNLQVLGQPLVSGDRHKLTLEMTVEEATWKGHPQQQSEPVPSPSKLAHTLEDSDDVLIDIDQRDDVTLSSTDSEDGGVVGAQNESDEAEEDSLNRTGSNLDSLEQEAIKLESWLERKLREEVDLDEDLSSSLKKINNPSGESNDASVVPQQSKALLGNSLSSDFFKNIKQSSTPARVGNRGDDLLPVPPPEYSPTDDNIDGNPVAETETATDESGSVKRSSGSLSDALYAKRQETACAVAQMRERLRVMGILDRTKNLATGSEASEGGVGKTTEERSVEPSEGDENVSVAKDTEKGNEVDMTNSSHPPPPPPTDVKVCKEESGGESDDDTASTASGGSDIAPVVMEAESNQESESKSTDATASQPTDDTALMTNEEQTYRDILR